MKTVKYTCDKCGHEGDGKNWFTVGLDDDSSDGKQYGCAWVTKGDGDFWNTGKHACGVRCALALVSKIIEEFPDVEETE